MIHGNIPFTSFRMEYIHMNETYLDKAGNLLDICMSKFCLTSRCQNLHERYSIVDFVTLSVTPSALKSSDSSM